MDSHDAAINVALAGQILGSDSPLGMHGYLCASLVTKQDSRALDSSPRNVLTAPRVGRDRGRCERCGQFKAELESPERSRSTHGLDGGVGHRAWDDYGGLDHSAGVVPWARWNH